MGEGLARESKMDPRGSKKEAAGGEISTPEGLEKAVWPLEASRGVLGGRRGSGGRSWRKRVALVFFETAQKVFFELPGSILGTSWRVLGRFWVLFPPPWGGPGRLRELIFGGFVKGAAREAKNRENSCMFASFSLLC